MNPIRRFALVLIAAFVAFFSGCTIAQTTKPAPAGVTISTVYVGTGDQLHMSGFVPEVAAQVRQLGFKAETYQGAPPKEAVHVLDVTANWRWDMAMYLHHFRGTLLEEGRVLGTVEYDARMGGANMGKFGHTADKIRPLITELFKNVRPAAPSATATATAKP